MKEKFHFLRCFFLETLTRVSRNDLIIWTLRGNISAPKITFWSKWRNLKWETPLFSSERRFRHFSCRAGVKNIAPAILEEKSSLLHTSKKTPESRTKRVFEKRLKSCQIRSRFESLMMIKWALRAKRERERERKKSLICTRTYEPSPFFKRAR